MQHLKRLVTVLMMVPVGHVLFAQVDIRSYVNNNTATIASIDPEAAEFEDLTPIGNAIGDARIVMLGEQDHGDAPTIIRRIFFLIGQSVMPAPPCLLNTCLGVLLPAIR